MQNLRNRIWTEMKTAKTYSQCLIIYTDRNRKNNRVFNWMVAAVSFTAVLANDHCPHLAWASSIVVAVVMFLKNVGPMWLQPEDELAKLDHLITFYSSYLADMELLWIEYESDLEDKSKILSEFIRLKKRETDQLPVMNKYLRGVSQSEQEKINESSVNYLKENFYNEQ